jgi:hypothetical protein
MVVLESEIETRMYLRDVKKRVEYAIPSHDRAEALLIVNITNNFICAIFM